MKRRSLSFLLLFLPLLIQGSPVVPYVNKHIASAVCMGLSIPFFHQSLISYSRWSFIHSHSKISWLLNKFYKGYNEKHEKCICISMLMATGLLIATGWFIQFYPPDRSATDKSTGHGVSEPLKS